MAATTALKEACLIEPNDFELQVLYTTTYGRANGAAAAKAHFEMVVYSARFSNRSCTRVLSDRTIAGRKASLRVIQIRFLLGVHSLTRCATNHATPLKAAK
jgi:hypothetical protein